MLEEKRGKRWGKANRVPHRRTAPTAHPTSLDIAWAAGIWEGEGSISKHRPSHPSLTMIVTQKDTWLLHKLKRLFGGGVYLRNKLDPSKCSTWALSGARAYGFLYTIFTYLSPRRREQIRRVLEG